MKPELIPGSGGVYDIVADNKILFSKKGVSKFPNHDEIIELIKKTSP
ncbi:MAG: Rdx family protein [Desulfobacula sp.]|nr:Rdx family protein [Desulfobacula sp.]